MDYQIEMSRYAALMKSRVGDGHLSHQHVPGTEAFLMGVPVSINAHGFRDKEYPSKKGSQTYRVMHLGDSLTFGWGAHAEARFTNRLEKRLNEDLVNQQSEMSVQMVNTGIGNYNTEQEWIFFEREGYKFKPDMIMLNYFINDAELTPQKRAPWILKYSYAAMWLWGRLDTLKRLSGKKEGYFDYYRNLYEEGAPGWEIVKSSLKKIAAYAKQNNIYFIVTILPELHVVGKDYAFAEIHAKVRSAALEAGAGQVYDLAEAFKNEKPETLWVSPDDAHPNDYAHGIIANALYQSLKRDEVFQNAVFKNNG